MSLSISIPKTAEQIPLDGLLALTRTAFGLGIGLLVAEHINRPARQATAIALVSVGALAAVPLLVKMALERINRPESERGRRRACARFGAIRATPPRTTFIRLFALGVGRACRPPYLRGKSTLCGRHGRPTLPALDRRASPE